MFFRQIHSYFSFRRLLTLLLALAIGIQLIVISYNHFTGYYVLQGVEHFFLRMLRGSLLSLLAGFLVTYPDLFLIRYLNKKYPWGSAVPLRIALQLGFAVAVAVTVSLMVTLFANFLKPYTEDLGNVLFSNAMIYSVVNVILMAVLEGWISFIETRRARLVAESLKDELSQIKFEVLKSQINPHFMFNSLNVLSGLINSDVKKAQQFIDEFSHIYRYVLETIEQPVTTLGKELEFMRSYLFLQQIRYGEALSYTIDIPAKMLLMVLPPLSLQVILENATKHNIVNDSKPLLIEVFNQENMLVVRNNIQPKVSGGFSTGLGLKNLIKRYNMVCGHEPTFRVETDFYVARLPLINNEENEGTDN